MKPALYTFFMSLIPLFSVLHSTIAQMPKPSENYVRFFQSRDHFPLVANEQSTPILLDSSEYSGVIKTAQYFQHDIQMVTGSKPVIQLSQFSNTNNAIIAGTIGKSEIIDRLVRNGVIDIGDVENNWEATLLQVVNNPLPGIDRALVIAGSDKRGTIYGLFDISRKMGVSPWYWWADVPVKKQSSIFVKTGRYVLESPKVKYRGIFLNDEEPALGRWAVENYGGFNHEFYEKVFELLLRLKANYLWPAMWWAQFNVNDPLNPELAHEMGIVMGTSHHEPMMRAHKEWTHTGKGEWDYTINEKELRAFWKHGIERMIEKESLVTIGMRGDGDMSMGEETNIELLERIVRDQRAIIRETTGKDPSEVPQVWALYKEVLDYYDKGMEVPEDVTLLLCDDNWGNVRRLPELKDTAREGGYGMYYHFDYVGGPRNYKWLNTNQVTRVWEQMHVCYKYGVKKLWLVNVGDLKPMELPVSFFLDFAWDPDEWTPENIDEYTYLWAGEQFGEQYAAEIAGILREYTRYNARRKPELLDSDTYSLINYQEFERVVTDYSELEKQAKLLNEQMQPAQQPAFYQLVYHPVQASANVNELYYTVALNHLYARQGRPETNQLAEKARALFEKDQTITDYYHHELMNGKWNHMMAQTHIGYTSWQEPEENIMPDVKYIEPDTADELHLAVQGTDNIWKTGGDEALLPGFDSFNEQEWFFEIFNRGPSMLNFEIIPSHDFILFTHQQGKVHTTRRIHITIDWQQVPEGLTQSGFIVRSGNQKEIKINLDIKRYPTQLHEKASGFVVRNGVASMEAPHFSRAVHSDDVQWKVIPGLGRTLAGLSTFPVTSKVEKPRNKSPALEYDFFIPELKEPKEIKVKLYFAPTLDYHNNGLFYAVSVNDEAPRVVNLHEDQSYQAWADAVSNNCLTRTTTHKINGAGLHTLKYWMVSGGVVLQKAVIDLGGLKQSYLGPPESQLKK